MADKKVITLKNSLIVSFIFYFMIFQIVIFLGLGVLLRISTNNMIFSLQKKNLIVMADSMKDVLTIEIHDIEELVFAHTMNRDFHEGLKKGDYFNVDIILKHILNQNSFFETVFLADQNGIITASTRFNNLRANISGMEYFKASVQGNQEKYVTPSAIISEVTGNPVIVFSSPIRDNGQVIGMLGVSLDLGLFGEATISDKRIGKTGYGFVLDHHNTIIIHPDLDVLMEDTSELDFIQDIRSLDDQQAFLSYRYKGEAKQGAFIKIEAVDWMIVASMPDSEIKAISRSLTGILVIILVVSNILMGFFLFALVRIKITRKLIPLQQLMGKAAQGELGERGAVTGSDELASITDSYNTLAESLGAFFRGMNANMEDLESRGLELSANMEETAAAVHQIKANINSSMGQFHHQEESVNSTVSAVEQMTRNIESQDISIDKQNGSIVESSSAVEEMIAQNQAISASAEEAENYMKVLMDSSEEGRSNIRHVADLVTTISEKSNDLEAANSLISGIAARTNLLAMNAAIEAAHAGDAGRGFAVVSDEIRKLAEQSTSQSAQVKSSIAEMNQFIKDVVDGSHSSGQSYEIIQKNIRRMGELTSIIRSSMNEQAAGGSMILNSLTDMRQYAADVQSGSQEMTQGNKVILEEVSKLRDINDQLNMAMKEITHGIDEINQSVLDVSELTGKNRDSIKQVRDDASLYKL